MTHANTEVPPKLLSPDDVTARISFAKNTLAAWRVRGVGPKFVKIRGRIFYREDELNSWLNSFESAQSSHEVWLREHQEAGKGV